MGMFDYKNYSSDEAANLVEDISLLSAYTGTFTRANTIAGAEAFNEWGRISGDLFANDINIRIPDGWTELKPIDFGVSDDLFNDAGYFTIPSFYTGTDKPGPEAKIFGQYNESDDLVRINFNLAGTNSSNDIVDYGNINSREGFELYDPILKMVKGYALDHGLEGSDVVISGYSLGAAVTNVIAAERENLADGFYNDAGFLGFAVPTIYDNSDVVLNVGYENDVVHRFTGNEPDLLSAIQATDFGLVNPDKDFSSSTDNLVIFNDVYASPIWDVTPFSFLSFPISWAAHINGVTTDAISLITDSPFYEDTQQDSTVIVSCLSALKRDWVWVEDDAAHTSSHFDSAAFLIGTKYGDKIAGGSNFDYIDGGDGDDIIKAGIGVDHIDGNTGTDEVRIAGRGKEWDVFKMEDDTLFFVDKDGSNLVEADNVESVSFEGEWTSHYNNYDITENGLQDNRLLMKWLDNGDKEFLNHVEGSHSEDILIGQTVFAREGNDTATGTQSADMLHAGRGDDIVSGLAGDDRIYGAEGDDRLDGGTGDDTLIGGIGEDTFVINSMSGSDVIVDFNNDAGYQDTIEFSSELFANQAQLIGQTTQSDSNVVINVSNGDYLIVNNTTVEEVLAGSAII